MNITDLRKKYEKARGAYLKHRYTNKTNNIEAEYIETAQKFLEKYYDIVLSTPDGFLNYVGSDFIALKDGVAYVIDLKVCQFYYDFDVLVDAKKKDENCEWIDALDMKINDLFLFINHDHILLVDKDIIQKKLADVKDDDLFFMHRDIYHTTKKAVLRLKKEDYIKCEYNRV